MPDREKVIKGLGIVSRMLNEMGRRNEMDIVDDALELLKEQEPIWNDVLNVWTCPSCGQMVSTNYCRDCGRKVKWE